MAGLWLLHISHHQHKFNASCHPIRFTEGWPMNTQAKAGSLFSCILSPFLCWPCCACDWSARLWVDQLERLGVRLQRQQLLLHAAERAAPLEAAPQLPLLCPQRVRHALPGGFIVLHIGYLSITQSMNRAPAPAPPPAAHPPCHAKRVLEIRLGYITHWWATWPWRFAPNLLHSKASGTLCKTRDFLSLFNCALAQAALVRDRSGWGGILNKAQMRRRKYVYRSMRT